MNDSKFFKSFHELLVKQMFGQQFLTNLEKLINLFLEEQVFYLKNEKNDFKNNISWIKDK